ncbi:uracil-DNA glycosylase family protein [Sandarakinorhabdus rubra]|uniref:uracil-DNA glycosylase family protein n=1 Tax=Sandarakinorhabdus rubra TaxID=2672568 RepID=UPI001F42518E|nr:uracil-DNA glycosylase family protein [Sandarakinorhabdus rubra]
MMSPPARTTAARTAAEAQADLAWLIAAGCDVPVADTPRPWLAAPRADATFQAEPPTQETLAAAPSPPPRRAVDPAASHPALACQSPDELLALLGKFPDARIRPPLLFEGALQSRVWVLIDRPDEEPAHRQTIDRMLASIELDWSRVALVSRLAWPTPGDGEPTANLLARFTPVLERLFALAPPRHVLALGQLAAEMAGPEARLASSRGRWFDWGEARLIPSLHPRTMLSKDLKRQAAAHLKSFREAIG